MDLGGVDSDIFEASAPTGAPWSPWAKPVLFAHLAGAAKGPAAASAEDRLDLAAAASSGTAFVVDLPGPESIEAGLELARLGFRPVPLFNGCPAPVFLGKSYDEAVPTAPSLSALIDGAGRIASAGLPLDAPPAFLLDADRLGRGRWHVPNVFDNRWVVFATDFPSARLLVERGIAGVRVLHDRRTQRGPDRRAPAMAAWRDRPVSRQPASVDCAGTLDLAVGLVVGLRTRSPVACGT